MSSHPDLPLPDAHALATSERLAALLHAEISATGGAIPFARFMEQCLYAPGLGYYAAGQRKFGPGGDFVTAPELTSLFGRCLAHSCQSVLEATGGGDILEFGAGSGRMAVDLLAELERLGCLPRRYLILERSAELKQRQQQWLQQQLPQLYSRVEWLTALPEEPLTGVMLGNEVLDAMAVERFRWDGNRIEQYSVVSDGSAFAWQTGRFRSAPCQEQVARIVGELQLPAGYESEINPALPGWMCSVAAALHRGLLLLIDYGYPRREYYHLQRSSGTLLAHYRQRAHNDVLAWPGLQDITAHVDFTAVAEAADAAGLTVHGYVSQSAFLLDCGIDRLLQQAGPVEELSYLREVQHAKTLLLPGEMGERFQCMGLVRGLEQEIAGFRQQDLRHRL